MAAALVAYVAFVVYQSLADGGGWACRGPILGLAVRVSRTDLLANVIAYVPVGALCVLVLSGRTVGERWLGRRVAWAIIAGVAGGAVLSVCMEMAQACQPARVSSGYDVATNVLGSALGAVAAGFLQAVTVPPVSSTARAVSALHLLTAAVIVGWVASQTLPWTFSVDVGTFRSNLSFLLHWRGVEALDGWRVLRHAGAWVAIGCACRLLARTSARTAGALVAAAASALFLQVLLDARAPLSFEELLGLALAAGITLLAVVSPAGRRAAAPWWAVGLAVGALSSVAAYELEPGRGVAAAGFSLWPQVGLAGLRGAIDYAVLFGWLGLACATADRWTRGEDARSSVRWSAIAVLLMFACELVQVSMPGRGADVSAPLFTLLGILMTRALLAVGRVT